MNTTREQIMEHYRQEVEKHADSGTSTIQDIRTRRLEMEALFGYVHDGQQILEIGCGNGYVAEQLIRRFDVDLHATDFSQEMIVVAKQRDVSGLRGRVRYAEQDVLTLDAVSAYDLIFTERCIQNLTSWQDQQLALNYIARALKPRGEFVMLESFLTGLNRLNAAREELELPHIDPPWHNVFFDEDMTKAHMASVGCEYVDQNAFLSGYYFGSRVLLPALMPKGKVVSSGSALNDYFCHLPAHGDFCPMKILRFRRTV